MTITYRQDNQLLKRKKFILTHNWKVSVHDCLGLLSGGLWTAYTIAAHGKTSWTCCKRERGRYPTIPFTSMTRMTWDHSVAHLSKAALLGTAKWLSGYLSSVPRIHIKVAGENLSTSPPAYTHAPWRTYVTIHTYIGVGGEDLVFSTWAFGGYVRAKLHSVFKCKVWTSLACCVLFVQWWHLLCTTQAIKFPSTDEETEAWRNRWCPQWWLEMAKLGPGFRSVWQNLYLKLSCFLLNTQGCYLGTVQAVD